MKALKIFWVFLLLSWMRVHADVGKLPAALNDWQDWVLKEQEYRRCPLSYGVEGRSADEFVCTWYGPLQLEANKQSGQFALTIEVFRDGFVALPGDEQVWPRDVKHNGNAMAVVARDGRPQVYLKTGRYQLSGEYAWRERPAELLLPPSLALVNLTLDGVQVSFPRRDPERVWLGASTEKQTEQDSLDVQVYRLLQDGQPFINHTQIHLTVTGRAREVVLGRVLLDGFMPVDLHSEMASKLDNNGVLTVQALPGDWVVHVYSRAAQLPTQLKRLDKNEVWPADEVWSFVGNDALRAVSFDGGIAVDPSQLNVPPEWQSFPAQHIAVNTVVAVNERARGTQDLRNHLNWQRDMWLRFDGSRFSFVDHINGQMRSDWRLNVQANVQLLNATVNGSAQPITTSDEKMGVEVREQNVNVQSSGELDASATMTASGWQQLFDSASLRLHLPPGYRLLTATGVDEAQGSFLSQWNLFDCFIVVLTCAVIFRLAGALWTLLALFTLVSLYHQQQWLTWLLLNAVAIVLVSRFVEGKLALWLQRYRTLSIAILLLVAVPFVAGHIRELLHPQLESRLYAEQNLTLGESATDAVALYAPGVAEQSPPTESNELEEQRAEAPVAREPQLSMKLAPESMASGARSKSYDRYSQNTINQAGNGIPNWQWRTYQLSWQGPLSADQPLKLFIVSRVMYALWQWLALLALSAILFKLLQSSLSSLQWQSLRNTFNGSSVAIVILACLYQGESKADVPTAELLAELRARLTAPPPCAPSCVDVSDADIKIDAQRLTITMTIHALFDSSVPLPGGSEEWTASLIQRNGQTAVLHQTNGQWHMALSRGVHRVQLSGTLPARNRISVQFPAIPRHVTVNATGWEAMGLDGNRLPSGALELLRTSAQSATNKLAENQVSIAPFVRVHRQLFLGLDWTSETIVQRIAPTQAAFSIKIPLAPNEALSNSSLRVENGFVQLNFAAGEQEKRYQAKLPRVAQLEWQDARDDLVAEWSIYPSSLWRVTATGTPLIVDNGDPSILHFVPRPDEKLLLTIDRPDVVVGNTVAYDSVQLNDNVGQRQRTGNLILNYRATQGGEQRLRFDQDLHVTAVLMDGRPLVQRPQEGELAFNVLPGQHQLQVDFERQQEVGFRSQTAEIELPLSAANITINTALPSDRWIIWTSGPLLGPVVLYWSALLVFIVLAYVIVRARLTDLTFRNALLLGLGLSTVSWWVLAGLLAWLAFIRRHHLRELAHDQLMPRWRYNTRQFVLMVSSIVAVIALISMVPTALLSTPDMMLTGNNSYGNQLIWFADFADKMLPSTTVVSLPIWVYKGLMLVWAIWLSFVLLSWIRSAWQALNRGEFWRAKTIIKTSEEAQP